MSKLNSKTDMPSNNILARVHALSKILFLPRYPNMMNIAGTINIYLAMLCADQLKIESKTTDMLNNATLGSRRISQTLPINAATVVNTSILK